MLNRRRSANSASFLPFDRRARRRQAHAAHRLAALGTYFAQRLEGVRESRPRRVQQAPAGICQGDAARVVRARSEEQCAAARQMENVTRAPHRG